jgi:transcriptional regulator with XRE-family HTH domain
MDDSVHPVRAYRLRRNPPISLEDLAERAGTTKGNLSRIENRRQGISKRLFPKLVAATGIPAHVLDPDLAKLFQLARPRRPKRARAAA